MCQFVQARYEHARGREKRGLSMQIIVKYMFMIAVADFYFSRFVMGSCAVMKFKLNKSIAVMMGD